MEGGLDSPFSPDPSPCPCASPGPSPCPVAYDDTSPSDHGDRGEDREEDTTGRRHTENPVHEKIKPKTANWGLSTPTPRQRERDNNHNPYMGKDNNPFSNHRDGGKTNAPRNGGILSPMTPVPDQTHRSGGNSGINNASTGVIESHDMADFSPGHAVAYNHTLTTLVNNDNGDGVELSPVVRRQQTKTEKLRRLRPRDNNHTPIAVPVATGPIRRLVPNNLSSGLIQEHEQEEGRGGIKTGLDGLARVHLKGMGEPRGRPKLHGTKVTKPPSIIRISRTIAISSNFGVKNYRTVARKKKKNSVNSFVANGPILESIPESQELDFC